MTNFSGLEAFTITKSNYSGLLVLIFLIGWGANTLAQSREIDLTGVIYNKDGSQRVGKVMITDIATNTITTSEEPGNFKIKCSIGDTLLFKRRDYTDQKIKVLAAFVLVVYLQPNVNLNEVTVKDVTKKQELNDVMDDYNKKGVYNNGKTGVLAAFFHPINALFDLFGSGPKQARRFQNDASAELEQQQVSRKFTVVQVQETTGLKDVKLKNFMDSYRPAYQDCRNWNDYDAIAYIKKAYIQFEKDGEPALPKLY